MNRLTFLILLSALLVLAGCAGEATPANQGVLDAATPSPNISGDVPARPTIQLFVADETHDGLPGAYCWFQAVDDIACDPGPVDPQPETAIAVAQGDTLTFSIGGESGPPTRLYAVLLDDAGTDGEQAILPLEADLAADYLVELAAGTHRLSVVAEFTGTETDTNFVTSIFTLDVAGAVALEPTVEATTEEQAAGLLTTEEPTAEMVEATEEPTEEPTTVPTEVPTEIPTEEPTAVPTELPTEEPTAVPTEVPTEIPTNTPTPVPPTATLTPVPPTPVPPTATATLLPPTPVPPTAAPPTSTPPVQPTLLPPATASLDARAGVPLVELVKGDTVIRAFEVEFCATGTDECETFLLETDQRLAVPSGETIRIDAEGAGPRQITVIMAGATGEQEISRVSFPGNVYSLYTVDGQPGSYILLLETEWSAGSVTHRFGLDITD